MDCDQKSKINQHIARLVKSYRSKLQRVTSLRMQNSNNYYLDGFELQLEETLDDFIGLQEMLKRSPPTT